MVIVVNRASPRLILWGMCGVVMASSAFLIFIYDPVPALVKQQTELKPGTVFYNLWSEPPIDVLIDVFIHHTLNAQEFLEGKDDKLKYKQMGPYVYQEILVNRNGTMNENGTMTFYPVRYLKFRRDLSVGDVDEDRVITANIPLIGIAASLQDSSFFTNMGLAGLASSLNSPQFLNLTIAQYLWGYDDKLVTLANKFIPSWINFGKFGILDRLMALDNATNVVTLNMRPELNLSSPNLPDELKSNRYHIHRWNGSPGLGQWGYVEPEGNETVPTNTRCNMVEGAFEGTVLPNDLKENSSFSLYRRAFCRPVPFIFKGEGKSKLGFDGFKVQVDPKFLATPEENPENACYCIKGRCMPKGLASLAPCYYGIPIAISQPHFYNADPKLLEQVEGMCPNQAEHDTTAMIHKQLGIPLEAELRIQINLDVGQTKYNQRTKVFNNLVLPLFWLQLRIPTLPPSVVLLLNVAYHWAPLAQLVIVCVLAIAGVALIGGSAFCLLFWSTPEPSNGRLSFSADYIPVPTAPMPTRPIANRRNTVDDLRQCFRPEIRILK